MEMLLETAQRLAETVKKRLAPYCSRIEVAGSVRRRKPRVKDIDFVLIPSDHWNFNQEVKNLGERRAAGGKLIRVISGAYQIDLYIATPETWATLFLIRTGSAENNIRLCTRARELDMSLHADGSGLLNARGERIAGDTEQSIFNALGLKYQEPWERG